jgi:hypothetical protein
MAVREFAQNQYVQWAIGSAGLATVAQGAFTVVGVAKIVTLGDTGALFDLSNAGNSRALFRHTDAGAMNYLRGSFDSPGDGPDWDDGDGWVLVAWTKAAGPPGPAKAVRYHKCVLSSDTWTHQDSAGTVDNDDNTCTFASTRANNDGDLVFRGRIAAIAVFDSVLNDTAVEALRDSFVDWLTAGPIDAWRFNQAATTDPIDDQTAGGADQTTLVGSTVVNGDDPPGFSFDAGGTVHDATVTVAASGAATAAGSRDLTATATAAGTGATSNAATADLQAAATAVATGQATAAGSRGRSATASTAASGTLTAAGLRELTATAATAAAAALAGSGSRDLAGAATLSGGGALTALGEGGSDASVTLAGAGGLSAAAAVTRSSTTTLAAAGQLSADGVRVAVATSAVAGAGALAPAATAVRAATVTVAATGTLTGDTGLPAAGLLSASQAATDLGASAPTAALAAATATATLTAS